MTQELVAKTKFRYSSRLESLLLEIEDHISYAIIGAWEHENKLGFNLLDISDQMGTFRVVMDDKTIKIIKIQAFINSFFNNKFHLNEINSFINDYNKLIPLKDTREYKRIKTYEYEKEIFTYKPTNVYYTFNSLCYQTYPHGTENKILKFMPVPGLTKDPYGNYYVKVGESDTMFTSHLDSACRNHEKVHLLRYTESGNVFIISNGKTIISADDKAGVTVLLYMITHNIPGLYYFFIGEERGGIGSGLLSNHFNRQEHLKGLNKCVSFDRRNYHSIITHQGGRRCCTDLFANSLIEEFGRNGLLMKLDTGGSFTDSANFVKHITECTNISVGYFNEHTHDEIQNISFLEALCKVCVKVDWNSLKMNKQAIVSKEILNKYNLFLNDLSKLELFCSNPLLRAYESSPDSVFVELKLSSNYFQYIYEDMKLIQMLLEEHNLEEANILFTENCEREILLNIELN